MKKIFFQCSFTFFMYLILLLFLPCLLIGGAIYEIQIGELDIIISIIIILIGLGCLFFVYRIAAKRIVFYTDKIIFYNEIHISPRKQIAYYEDIKRFKVNKKRDEGDHIVTIKGKKLYTLVLYCRKGKKLMIGLQYYSQRQIDKIVKELSVRIEDKEDIDEEE